MVMGNGDLIERTAPEMINSQRRDAGMLANQQNTASINHQHALLLFALDRNKPHAGALKRLAASLGIGSYLVPTNISSASVRSPVERC